MTVTRIYIETQHLKTQSERLDYSLLLSDKNEKHYF